MVCVPNAFEFLWTPSRYKAVHGGRGSAKSHSLASALVLQGAEGPKRVLCAREIQKSIAASVKQLLEDKIKQQGLKQEYDVTEYRIRHRWHDTSFTFAGLRTNPESIKSMEGIDVAWVEEADAVSQRSINLLTPTLRNDNSEIWFGWNRRNKTDPVDNMFLGGEPPPKSIVRQVNWRDNPWFPKVLMEELEWDKRRDYDKYLHVWEGHPITRSEAKVFQNWRVDDIDDQVPDGCVPRYGADWGFSVDPTVLVKAYVFDRTVYFREEAYKVKCEIDETPSLFAGTDKREDARWPNKHGHPGVTGSTEHPIIADSARPETISYMRARGFNVRRAVKGAKSVEEGVEFLKSFDIVVHPDCKHVAQELGLYSYKVDKLTDEVIGELEDRNNHTIDAARYALESMRRKTRGRVGLWTPELIDLEGP